MVANKVGTEDIINIGAFGVIAIITFLYIVLW